MRLKIVNNIEFESMNKQDMDYNILPVIDTPEIKNQTFKVSPERYAAIKKSIEQDGLREPVKMAMLGSDGTVINPETKKAIPIGTPYLTIIDGHTRRDILKDLGIPLGFAKTLPMQGKYENFIVLEDVFNEEDAVKLVHILNDFRRQADKYQLIANALKVREIKIGTDREIASKIGVAHSTVTQVRNILEKYVGFQKPNEKPLADQLMQKLESGEKSIKDVYVQFNVANEVSELVNQIEDPKFQNEMSAKYETEKYTNKNALKQLQEEIKSHALTKEEKYVPTPYDKKLYPVMTNLVKLEEKGYDLKTVIYKGSQSSITNTLDSIQKYLRNNMDENVVDVLEAVREIILKEYETEIEGYGNVPKNLPSIMKKITKIFKERNSDYFAMVMQKPNNPKPEDKSVAKGSVK